MEFRKLCSTV